MKQEEAIRLVLDKYPNHEVDKVTETENYFLVAISPKRKQNIGIVKLATYDDGLKAVDKVKKDVFTYNPLRHGR